MSISRRAESAVLFPVARAVLSATFLISAARHLTHWSAAPDEMAGDRMPRSSFLLTGSIVLRVIGGLSILFGFYARAGAALLLVLNGAGPRGIDAATERLTLLPHNFPPNALTTEFK